MTVVISNSRKNPEVVKCGNFEECGYSTSHDPAYVGWYQGVYTFFHSPECAAKYALRHVVESLRLDSC